MWHIENIKEILIIIINCSEGKAIIAVSFDCHCFLEEREERWRLRWFGLLVWEQGRHTGGLWASIAGLLPCLKSDKARTSKMAHSKYLLQTCSKPGPGKILSTLLSISHPLIWIHDAAVYLKIKSHNKKQTSIYLGSQNCNSGITNSSRNPRRVPFVGWKQGGFIRKRMGGSYMSWRGGRRVFCGD